MNEQQNSTGKHLDKYFGKYRGVVVNNIDPEMRGRIQAMVPDVSNTTLSNWALPCVPMAGIQTGTIAVPPSGSLVWIEYEKGDADRPVWVGGFWGSAAELPAMATMTPPALQSITMQTTLQNGITISDSPGPSGGIMLKSAAGATIIVNDTGIYIQNGQGASIVLTGPTVNVNAGALTVI